MDYQIKLLYSLYLFCSSSYFSHCSSTSAILRAPRMRQRAWNGAKSQQSSATTSSLSSAASTSSYKLWWSCLSRSFSLSSSTYRDGHHASFTIRKTPSSACTSTASSKSWWLPCRRFSTRRSTTSSRRWETRQSRSRWGSWRKTSWGISHTSSQDSTAAARSTKLKLIGDVGTAAVSGLLRKEESPPMHSRKTHS